MSGEFNKNNHILIIYDGLVNLKWQQKYKKSVQNYFGHFFYLEDI